MVSGPDGQRCDACYFFVRIIDTVRGRCRRFPPMPVNAATFPNCETSQDNWCGEFRKKPELTPEAPRVQVSEPAKGRRR
jgi:hypothetical protein